MNNNQTAIVTGGSRGYGAGITKVLVAAGWTVIITGRDEKALLETAKATGAQPIVADVSSASDWERVVKAARAVNGHIDALINNAGSSGRIAALEDIPEEDIVRTIHTNLIGAIIGCQCVLPIMKARGSGSIINISSVCARYAWPAWSVYSAAKAGLDQFTRALYTEARPFGLRATILTPSWGVTDFAGTSDLKGHPANDLAVRSRCTHPEELGEAVLHILRTPPHLGVLDYTLLPLVQQIEPL